MMLGMENTASKKVGNQHRDYVYTKVLPLEELQMALYELKHEPTGARVVHLEANDPENLFCLSLQTLPHDSTGVAHILEHTVLCGSKKFPVKDPFFSMVRRSLNTFMNAMTGADFTCYPAASQVEKDFYNLLEVYLDAVFYPELKEMSFLQEGHRLELDPNLVYKGVVYNEMKGSLSNPETRLWHELTKYLTPDLTYAFNSGGNPEEIPNLTWKQLKEFHATYYHPSRCIFFFYGNLSLENHLDFVEKNALKGVKKLPLLKKIPKQKRFKKPETREGKYPGESGQQFVSFSWLTCPIDNQEDALALALIDSILMETDASPLKYELLKSKLCTQADGYLDTDMSEIPYIIICRGCDEGNAENLKQILLGTLKNLKIKPEQIEAAIHQLEFSRLEITGDHGPFGLTLFMRSILAMQHGCPAENALTVYSQFKKLRLLVKDPNFLSGIIQKYFLDNPHFLTHIFSPDNTLEKCEEKEEKTRLKTIEKRLTKKDRDAIKKQTKALEKYQEKIESQSLDCLPKIDMKDIPKDVTDFHLEHEQIEQLTVFHHECFTNHIVYARILFDLPQISYEDLPYLQLLISILPELGAGGRSYHANLDYINLYLGDFGASLSLYPQINDPNHLRPAFGFKGKVLNRNLSKLFSLFSDVCMTSDLKDKGRIKDLILQIHTSLENHLTRNAMTYAIQRSGRIFSLTPFINDSLSGLTYFRFIRKIAKNLDKNLPHLIEKFLQLKASLFHFMTPHLVLSCDKDQYRMLSKEKFFNLSSLPSKPFTTWEGYSLPSSGASEAHTISSPVAFSSLGVGTITHSPVLSVSTNLMENTFLHKKLREQGGAYGGGANYNPLTGSYYLYSYRDPHISSTFETFLEGMTQITKGKFTQRDLNEAKLGILQDADAPVSPGSRASVAYSYFREGQTKQTRKEFRDHLLSVTREDVKETVNERLDPSSGIKATFAGVTLLQNENPGLKIEPI